MERVEIGKAVILLDTVGTDPEGRTIYGYSIRLDGVNATHQANDLKSGCQGGTERQGMCSLLCFLATCGESRNYRDRTGREVENADLFPEPISQWAQENADELGLLAFRYEDFNA